MFAMKIPLKDIVSPLPPELGELVLRVVRRTKLWPGEKRDVAQELTGHFLDGLETLERSNGLDPSAAATQLASDFGDERIAAKLIRRSKVRCRPWPWKAFVLSLRTFLVGFGLIALLAGWRMTGSPNPRVNYVAQLNATADSIPESEKAWPLYREAVEHFHGPWGYEFFKADRKHWHELTPENDAWPEVRQWLSECEPTVNLLKTAGNRPFLGVRYGVRQDTIFLRYQHEREQERVVLEEDPLFEDWLSKQNVEHDPGKEDIPMMMEVLLPYLSPMRDMARMMVLRSQDHAVQGNITEAVDDLLIVLQMGNHFLGESILITQLVGANCVQLADRGLRDLLAERGDVLSSDSLQRIGHAWAGSIPADGIHVRLESERLAIIDTVQHVFTENAWGDGHLVIRGRNSWESVMGGSPTTVALLHAGRKATLQKHDEIWAAMMERMSAPLYSSERSDADGPIRAWAGNPWQRARYAVISTLLPSLSRADEVLRQAAMEHEATLTVIALTAYRNETGRYPEQLTDLVPAHLPSVPEDIYDGKPLKYRLDGDGGPVLYSIWEDFIDDAGKSVDESPKAANPKLGDKLYLAAGAN